METRRPALLKRTPMGIWSVVAVLTCVITSTLIEFSLVPPLGREIFDRAGFRTALFVGLVFCNLCGALLLHQKLSSKSIASFGGLILEALRSHIFIVVISPIAVFLPLTSAAILGTDIFKINVDSSPYILPDELITLFIVLFYLVVSVIGAVIVGTIVAVLSGVVSTFAFRLLFYSFELDNLVPKGEELRVGPPISPPGSPTDAQSG